MISFIKKHWISILLFIAIAVLCLMSTAPLPKVEVTDFDKLVHLLMFLGVSGVVFFENTRYFRQRISSRRIFFGSILYPLLFSGAIEIAQEYFTPYRAGDWMDFLYDGIGVLIGLVICFGINSKLKYRESAI